MMGKNGKAVICVSTREADSAVPLLAFELGLSILRVLRSVPRPSYLVEKTNVPLYADQNCQKQRPDVEGVWLEIRGADRPGKTPLK